ncbi:MAG: hypothetical protein ACRDTC_20050 [Pseudonocardiaceae bacterium]
MRRRVRVGAPDPSLPPVSGMVVVTALVDRLGMIMLLDAVTMVCVPPCTPSAPLRQNSPNLRCRWGRGHRVACHPSVAV